MTLAYTIIEAYNLRLLEQAVAEQIKSGWIPHVAVASRHRLVYTQAMCRSAEPL